MKIGDFVAFSAILLFGLAFVGIMVSTLIEPKHRRTTAAIEVQKKDTSSGLGIGTRGVGIEVAPGLIMGFDGKLGFGVGF